MSIFYFANNHIELQLLILTVFLHAEQMTYAKAYNDKLFLATRSRNLTFLVTVFTHHLKMWIQPWKVICIAKWLYVPLWFFDNFGGCIFFRWPHGNFWMIQNSFMMRWWSNCHYSSKCLSFWYKRNAISVKLLFCQILYLTV